MGNWKTGDVITADKLNAMQTAVMVITLVDTGSDETPPDLYATADMSYKDVETLLSENIPILAIAQMPDEESYPAKIRGMYLIMNVLSAYKDSTDQTHPFHVQLVAQSFGNIAFRLDLTQSDEGYEQPLNGEAIYG